MLERGNYGVEWTTRKRDDDSSVLGRVVLIVVLVSLVSLAATIVKRIRADKEAYEETRQQQESVELQAEEEPTAQIAPPPPPPEVSRLEMRPPKVRNLLMRLEEAEKARDVEMAVSTIEALRSIPGAPAADLDNALARRLGVLNLRRLFTLKNGQWVELVEVKRGDSASRIASEHGSTLASLVKLNGVQPEKIRAGEKLYVMNHPRFNLVVHRRSRMADLQLNGKFFKRYDLQLTENLTDGAFEWREIVLCVKAEDKAELDMLLPRSTSVLISEL